MGNGAPPPAIPREPLFSPRRVAFAVALAAALAFLAYSCSQGGDQGGGETDPAVLRRFPAPGARVLRQSEIGAELEPGYDGRVSINGVPGPEEQMNGAIPEDSPEFDPELGVRPNNKNLVSFTPGAGKVIEELDTGEVRVRVRFWRITDGPEAAGSTTWTIYVT